MMTEMKLNRTRSRPLGFVGEQIYEGDTKKPDSLRWYKVRVFTKSGGGFVVGIALLTCMDGERDHYSAKKLENSDEVIWLIRRRVPSLEMEVSAALADHKAQ